MSGGQPDAPSRRAFLHAVGGGVAASTALAGCAGLDPEPAEDSPTSTTDGSASTNDQSATSDPDVDRALRVASESPETLDPVAAVDDVSMQLVSQLYEPLFSHPNGQFGVEPALAASVSVSDDYRTYTFELREDAVFHDGTAVTAEDVVYSFERAFASEHSTHGDLLDFRGVNLRYDTDDRGEYVPGSVGVAVVDERTVRVRVVEPFAWTLDVLALQALAVVPRGAAGDVDVMPAGGLETAETEPVGENERSYVAFAVDEPLGTGAFALESRDGDVLRLERFADYYGTAATVAGVEYRTFADQGGAYEHALETSADEGPDVFPVPPQAFDPGKLTTGLPDVDGRLAGTYGRLPSGETLQYQAAPALHTAVLCLNAERVSRPVRRALANVLAQRALVNDAFDGRSKPAVHFAPPALYPGGAAAYREHADAYPYGVAESRIADARERLSAAGFDGDSRATVAFASPDDRDSGAVVDHLQATVDPVPIDVETRSLGRREFEEEARHGRLDGFLRHVTPPTPHAGDVLVQAVPKLTNTDTDGGTQYLGLDWDWDGPDGITDAGERYETAWERYADAEAPTEAARARRIHTVVEMEEALWTDVPLIPLYHRVHERFHRERADLPAFSALGPASQSFDDVALDEDG